MCESVGEWVDGLGWGGREGGGSEGGGRREGRGKVHGEEEEKERRWVERRCRSRGGRRGGRGAVVGEAVEGSGAFAGGEEV